jgi:threonine dehydratase
MIPSGFWKPHLNDIYAACRTLHKYFPPTPLVRNGELSARHKCNVLLKREDLSHVRSYKWRGAMNAMSALSGDNKGIVTCSAGNHAQGVAYSCAKLRIKGDIYMPRITTRQKISKVEQFGGAWVNVFLEGDNFDDSFDIAMKHSLKNSKTFIHPFDDKKVIEGQATVGYEIIADMLEQGMRLDYVVLPVGGGGLCAGVSSYVREISPKTKIIGVEPEGAPSMTEAFANNGVVRLDKIDNFVDGAAVKKVGELNFPICQKNLDTMMRIEEGHVCSKILQMYNECGYIIEPAGVLSLCALDLLGETIVGKNVVAVVSGGNSDVFRMPEILERSLIYEGRKHYFRIEFPQRAGALKDFVLSALGPHDDIIYFRYTKLINKETGPVIIGIETRGSDDIDLLIEKMTESGILFEKLTNVSDIV